MKNIASPLQEEEKAGRKKHAYGVTTRIKRVGFGLKNSEMNEDRASWNAGKLIFKTLSNVVDHSCWHRNNGRQILISLKKLDKTALYTLYPPTIRSLNSSLVSDETRLLICPHRTIIIQHKRGKIPQFINKQR